MKEKGRNWLGWFLAAAFPLVFMLLVEANMANELFYRWHSYFLTSTYHRNQLFLFIGAMLLIPMPLIVGMLAFLGIENKMRDLGADKKAIESLQMTMLQIYMISYMLL